MGYHLAILCFVGAVLLHGNAEAELVIKPLQSFTGLQTELPFPHKIVAGSPSSDPFLLISGPSIKSEEENLYTQTTGTGGLYIGVLPGLNNSFEQPLEVMLSVRPGTLATMAFDGAGEVFVNGSALANTADVATKKGNVGIIGANLDSLSIHLLGSGNVAVKAKSIGQIYHFGQGNGSATFVGEMKDIFVRLYSSGGLLAFGNSTTHIAGEVQGTGKVEYVTGDCDVVLRGSNTKICHKQKGMLMPASLMS